MNDRKLIADKPEVTEAVPQPIADAVTVIETAGPSEIFVRQPCSCCRRPLPKPGQWP